MTLTYSKPKNLAGTDVWTQALFDSEKNLAYIAIIDKNQLKNAILNFMKSPMIEDKEEEEEPALDGDGFVICSKCGEGGGRCDGECDADEEDNECPDCKDTYEGSKGEYPLCEKCMEK